ncbi:MAG: hypothetical protein JST80_13900 [Bdellovibrionales bacterium]|nr:hypothetical protein [Bdellovibrionales bacterium]
MDSRLSPAKLFYPLALIVFTAILLFPSPLLPLVAFYCLLVGAIWSYVVTDMQIENPKMTEMAPPIFLLLFMGILTQALNRPTTETLFHTVRGLVMFRTLVFILTKVRLSPNPISKPMSVLVAAIVLEMVMIGTRVYHLIYPLDPMPTWLGYVETKVLAVTVAALMLYAYFQKNRSR